MADSWVDGWGVYRSLSSVGIVLFHLYPCMRCCISLDLYDRPSSKGGLQYIARRAVERQVEGETSCEDGRLERGQMHPMFVILDQLSSAYSKSSPFPSQQ